MAALSFSNVDLQGLGAFVLENAGLGPTRVLYINQEIPCFTHAFRFYFKFKSTHDTRICYLVFQEVHVYSFY